MMLYDIIAHNQVANHYGKLMLVLVENEHIKKFQEPSYVGTKLFGIH